MQPIHKGSKSRQTDFFNNDEKILEPHFRDPHRRGSHRPGPRPPHSSIPWESREASVPHHPGPRDLGTGRGNLGEVEILRRVKGISKAEGFPPLEAGLDEREPLDQRWGARAEGQPPVSVERIGRENAGKGRAKRSGPLEIPPDSTITSNGG